MLHMPAHARGEGKRERDGGRGMRGGETEERSLRIVSFDGCTPRSRRRSAIRERARCGTVNNFYDTLNSPPGIKRSSVGDGL